VCGCKAKCQKAGTRVHCDDDCVNRLLRIECRGGEKAPSAAPAGGEEGEEGGGGGGGGGGASSSAVAAAFQGDARTNCSVGGGCGNRALSERAPAAAYQGKPTRTPGKGWGLNAGPEGVQAGAFIIEYVGEIIDDEEQDRRLAAAAGRGEGHAYIMELSPNLFIDARFKSNLARFINHSCDPNAELQRWDVAGYARIGIFALRDIAPGEEITYDYKFWTAEELKCHCGAGKCRGWLGFNVANEKKAEEARKREEEAAKRKAAAAKRKAAKKAAAPAAAEGGGGGGAAATAEEAAGAATAAAAATGDELFGEMEGEEEGAAAAGAAEGGAGEPEAAMVD
jgi:hypothetical protein